MGRLQLLFVLMLLGFPSTANCEMKPQDRKTSTVVIEGCVEAIDERWTLETDYYTISVRVEKVERGQGVQTGDLFSVRCFQWTRVIPGKAGARGHRSIPDVGDRIRAFAYGQGLEGEGNYPD